MLFPAKRSVTWITIVQSIFPDKRRRIFLCAHQTHFSWKQNQLTTLDARVRTCLNIPQRDSFVCFLELRPQPLKSRSCSLEQDCNPRKLKFGGPLECAQDINFHQLLLAHSWRDTELGNKLKARQTVQNRTCTKVRLSGELKACQVLPTPGS